MKKAKFFSIILFSILIYSCDSISEEELKLGLDKNLKIYCSALKNFENQKLVDYFPPSLIESMGGREVFKTQVESQKEQFFDDGVSYKKITYSSPVKFKQTGNYIHSIVPIQTIVYTSENILTANAFLYCFSENYGDTWMIADYEGLKETYPDFKFEFHPDSKIEMIQDSCRFLTLDVFGSDVCVDRFIDSGAYIAESYNGRNVYKLVKKDKSVNFTDEHLTLIKSAIRSWESDVSIKCQFPEITESNIVYIKSEVGRFYLYDIYGIPFSYNSSGKIIQDTLSGCFKLERATSYQTTENLKKVRDEKDEFEILYEASELLR